MKAFIIHTPHQKSIEYANKALASFSQFRGWEPELFQGVTAETLSKYEKKFHLKTKANSRAEAFEKENHPAYKVKKSCSYNHYRLFMQCVELNEPIAVIEHDAHCIGEWTGHNFDDILVLNVVSALNRKASKYVWHLNTKTFSQGINDLEIEGMVYRHDDKINGAKLIPGTAAYAVTPNGAKKMLDVYENIGWEQSDFIINTAYVKIQQIIPELFTFKLTNLETSFGQNLK